MKGDGALREEHEKVILDSARRVAIHTSQGLALQRTAYIRQGSNRAVN
jgi:hypothetical protein